MKYIIFGAGNYGKRAFEYYGKENVVCFVDNNEAKRGTTCLGKNVVGLNEAITNYDEATIFIIAVKENKDVVRQLREMGVDRYICYSPEYEYYANVIRKRTEGKEIRSFGLYGIARDTNLIIEALKTIAIDASILFAIKSPYENYKKENLEYDIPVYDNIDDVSVRADYYIVSAEIHHFALEGALKCRVECNAIIDPYKKYAYCDSDEVIVNPYSSDDRLLSEDEWNNRMKNDFIIGEVRKYVDSVKDRVPLFDNIEIETINRCNGACSFCPVSKLNDQRPYLKMKSELFKKIIDELKQLEYSGGISLFSNNEPLLDDRIVEFHRYARENLPNSRIYLFSNGTLLSTELFLELIKYLDELIIDNYSKDLNLIKPVEEIISCIGENKELKRKVSVILRNPNEILTSRGGDAPNRKEMITIEGETCALPFEQMVIRPDGKVSLCCNDPYGKITLGDVSINTLYDVWYGAEYRKLRTMIAIGRERISHCKYCDAFNLYGS